MDTSALKESLLNTKSKDKWVRIGIKKRAGVVVPLFSVYSKESLGIGDFSDLKLLIDWAASAGFSILQMLPLNEAGALSCPYDAISSFALEPAYFSFAEFSAHPLMKSRIEKLRNDFSVSTMYVDYAIKEAKINLLRQFYNEEGDLSSKQLEEFKERNVYWLYDFALYKTLKAHYGGRPWYEWDDQFKNRNVAALKDFSSKKRDDIDFFIWLQWILYKQLKSAAAYARQKGVLLKGDLPILVSRDSADVWQRPEYFKLDFAAGAPPDMYTAKGQRWGMPTYDWERIASENFRYLEEKLRYAQEFYDILRIDHVVGLFRIWSIPYSEPIENGGLNGVFDPSEEKKWSIQGRNLLSVFLDNTKMLLCAEDLGVIPAACTDALKEFGIPGNDVQRWVKDWKIRHDFLNPEEYRQLSVAMLSTHDTTNWFAWWENEAGTIDEGLFTRRCSDHRNIDAELAKRELFDSARSRYGRLRWKEQIHSVDKLVQVLGKSKEELADFLDFYQNSFHEKEKLWQRLGIKGQLREQCDKEIMRAGLKITLDSAAIFCINTIIDWLYLAEIFPGDAYQFRINTPGTVSFKNWSLRIPIFLEDLLRHPVNREIRRMIEDSGRI
ncbi:MAG: 4-alpha-glucanotransferase [Candidatus Omnitrophica bacterium]|nr:4-alpha-glucanotransferase [Candidatus Omnitrophota bacterium]